MKFFGWGRGKDLPPTQPASQELKKSALDLFSEAARSAQRPETEGYGTRYGSEFVGHEDHVQPHVTPQERFALAWPSKYFSEEAGGVGSETWEERLQETIRFVFSHEQEGLLTIGTFALDQLAGVTNLDSSQNKPPATDRNSVSSNMQVAILEVRSSDDELIDLQQSMRSPIPAPCRRNLETSYPIFGDHDAPISCRLLSFGSTKPVDTGNDQYDPSCTDSAKTKTHAVAKIKQVVPSTTDSEIHNQSDSEGFYSPGVCSLFASRSRRMQKCVKEKQKKPPEKRKDDGGAYELKRMGSCKGSLGAQLGRLWRSGCPRSTKVMPEKKFTSSDQSESQAQGPPCIANVEEAAAGAPKPSPASDVGKQRKRRGHSFGKGWPRAHNGKWIRTDSEFVVLEIM